MSAYRGIVTAAFTAMAISSAAPTAAAEESGSFTALASLVTDYTMIEHAGGTIVGGGSAGTNTILETSGGPFAAGEHSHVTCVVYGKRSTRGVDARSALHIDRRRRRQVLLDVEEKRGRRRGRRWRRRKPRTHGRHRQVRRRDRHLHLRNRLPRGGQGRDDVRLQVATYRRAGVTPESPPAWPAARLPRQSFRAASRRGAIDQRHGQPPAQVGADIGECCARRSRRAVRRRRPPVRRSAPAPRRSRSAPW